MEQEDPTTDAARRWIIHLASGEMTGADQELLAAWLREDPRHVKAFEAEQRLWQIAGALGPGLLGDAAAELRELRKSAAPVMAAHARRRGWGRMTAAALAVIALTAFAFSDQLAIMLEADVSTSAGHRTRYRLPDGSTALLNTASALAVDYSDKQRSVRLLKGEAFFEVRPQADRPFRVQVGEGIAEAVGTAFAVQRAGSAVTVTVLEGKVTVALPRHGDAAKPPALVEAAHGLAFDATSGAARVQSVDAEKALAWRSGKVVFAGAPFAKAIAELDRYFLGRIVIIGDVGKATPVTGVVSTDEIVAGVRALAAVQGLSVTEAPGGLLLVLH